MGTLQKMREREHYAWLEPDVTIVGFNEPLGKIAEKEVWRSVFLWLYGIVYRMPIQQKLTPPVLLLAILPAG